MGSVYVSSTYEDLRDHRQAVFDAVSSLRHQAVGMEHQHASDKRPLDRCLEDVRRCNAYICLVAWRYGFVPKGQSKSITSLEYEEATRCGIPRYIFMAPANDWPAALRDSDPTRVTRFREALRENHLQSSEPFQNLHHLQYQVTAALKLELGEGREIPPLLSYRCDRTDQYDDIRDALRDLSKASAASPQRLIALIHGRDTQAVNKFLACLHEEAAPLCRAGPNVAVVWKELPWPSERSLEALSTATVGAVARMLDADERTPEAVAARLDEVSEPVVVHSRVRVDNWSRDHEFALRHFVAFWHGLPLAPRPHPVLLLLSVEYRKPELLERLRGDRRNHAIRGALGRLAAQYGNEPGVVLVRELEDVTLHHAEVWGDSEPVQALTGGADLRAAIGALFRSREGIPMQPLAPALQSLLEKKSSV